MLWVDLAGACRWDRKGLTTSATGEPVSLRPAPCLVSDLVLSFFLAGFACDAFRREGDHARIEFVRGLAGAASDACEFADGLAASQAFPSFLLFQLGSWKGVLYFHHHASAAGVPDSSTKLALSGPMLAVLAPHAAGRQIGAHFVPLFVFETVQGADLFAAGAGGVGGKAFSVCSPINRLAPQMLEEELRTFGNASAEEPERKRPEDQTIVAVANSAGPHSTDGCIHPLVHAKVQQYGN